MTAESASPVIDIDALLAPISEENPAGENLKYSGLYDEIRDARRADDTLSQGSWQRELKVSDWRRVIELSVAALETQTKDLQIAAWLAEALVKQHGFVGLRDSLRLMRGFHELFWETVFPEVDEGNDLEARANALEFMDRQASFAVKEVPISGGEGLNFLNLEESRMFDIPENLDALDSGEQDKFRALQLQATEENRVTGDRWRKAKNAARRSFYEEIFLTLEESWSEFESLDREMDDKFGNQTPGLSQLKKSLDSVRDAVKKIVLEKRELEPDAVDETANQVETVADSEIIDNSSGTAVLNFPATTSGAIRSRQDALKRLTDVADFFRQTEPHSPVSYLIQRAVRWGNMPLDAWLQDVVKDDVVLGHLRETLGVDSGGESYSADDS
ncbi:MAG TPA: type VI secretion system protein TssA [Pyrinomonadaceae bacterium]|nr:type VI secretion system protein TssA [Pyrinomonadaceae bacterium]